MCRTLMSIIKPRLAYFEDVEQTFQRVQQATSDFAYFCALYLSEAFTVPFADYHKILIEIINQQKITPVQIEKLKPLIKSDYHKYLKPVEKLEGIIDVEPREHGKTTRMSQAFPLWLALTKKEVFPVIIAMSREKATEYLDSIKLELDNNDLINEDFGDQRGHIWKSNRIVLKNGNAIAALGRGESIRGIKYKYRRPTHIICDDLLKDKEVESPTLREYTDTWFKRVIMNLGKESLIILVNTIMHPDDLPSRRLNDLTEGKLTKWIGLKFSAVLPNGKPLWPQMWPAEAIEQKKISLGTHVFATEWDNNPLPNSAKKFRKEQMKYFNIEDVNLMEYEISMGIDPATGKELGSASAIAIVGKHQRGYIDVLDEFAGQISDLEFIDIIIEKYLLWMQLSGKPSRYVIFEEMVFQEIYKNFLVREAMKKGVTMNVTGRKQTANKLFRISRLAAPVESGIIRFKCGLKLPNYLDEFPKGLLDLPDALEMAVAPWIKEPKPQPSAHRLGQKSEAAQILERYK